MQNFKQYLMENNLPEQYPCLQIEIELVNIIDDVENNQIEELKEQICAFNSNIEKTQLKIKHYLTSPKKNYFTLLIPIKGKIDDNIISSIKKFADKCINDYFKLNDKFVSDLVDINCTGIFPKDTFIDVDRVSVSISNKNDITLNDIHKHVNCKRLVFLIPKVIKGNVLGLLKIKKLTTISVGFGPKLPEWLKIINNHLASKDILACQDELLENGLKEYAKL